MTKVVGLNHPIKSKNASPDQEKAAIKYQVWTATARKHIWTDIESVLAYVVIHPSFFHPVFGIG
jgi:hypothetical protein